MKPIVVIVLGAELLVAMWFASSMCILRKDLTRAIRAAHERPVPETFGELEHQQRISRVVDFTLGAGIFAVLALPTLDLTCRRPGLGRQSTQPAVQV